MQNLLYTEINLFCLVIMMLVFFNVYHRAEKNLPGQKLFLTLILVNSSLLVLDTGMWLTDGLPGHSGRLLAIFITTLYFIMNPVICLVWTLYADFQVYNSTTHLRRIFPMMILPALLSAIISLISIQIPVYFWFDQNNHYHRGDSFLLMFLMSYIYLFYTLFHLTAKRKTVPRKALVPLLIFSVPPLLAGILQTLFFGLSVVWVGTTISILIIFINVQNNHICTDYLTGLYNRRQLDSYLDSRLKNNRPKRYIAGFMLDLNSFKMINDKYGHDAGDQALRYAARLLQKTFGKNDFAARYGGDEFVVIMDVDSMEEADQMVYALRQTTKRFNEQHHVPYDLEFSIGYDIFVPSSKESVTEFIKHIDRLMYKNKFTVQNQ